MSSEGAPASKRQRSGETPASVRLGGSAEASASTRQPANGAAAAAASAASKMLHTVEDVLAALPGTPSCNGKASNGEMPATLESLLPQPAGGAQAQAAVTKQPPSPMYPGDMLAPSARCRPAFSAEPPSLDLATATVFESPALMPLSTCGLAPVVAAIDSLPGLPGQMTSQTSTTGQWNPLSRRAPVADHGSSLIAGQPRAAEPAEGGILMLADIEESHASRVALVSAWRDYGSKVSLVPSTIICPMLLEVATFVALAGAKTPLPKQPT